MEERVEADFVLGVNDKTIAQFELEKCLPLIILVSLLLLCVGCSCDVTRFWIADLMLLFQMLSIYFLELIYFETVFYNYGL